MPSPSSRRASELGSGLAPGRGAWPESERVGRAKPTLGLARFRPPGPRGWPGGRGTGTHVAAREGSSPGLGWPCPPSLAGAWGGRDRAATVHREVCARLCVPRAATPGASAPSPGAPAHRTLGLRDPQAGVRRDPPLPAFWFGSPGPEPRVVQWPTGAGSPPTGLTSVEAPLRSHSGSQPCPDGECAARPGAARASWSRPAGAGAGHPQETSNASDDKGASTARQ